MSKIIAQKEGIVVMAVPMAEAQNQRSGTESYMYSHAIDKAQIHQSVDQSAEIEVMFALFSNYSGG